MTAAYLHRRLNAKDPARLKFLHDKQAAQKTYVADLQGGLDPEIQGQEWADFAAQQVEAALAAAWHQCRAAQPYLRDFKPGQAIPGLFILGLGKLGGQDLNFSSDIDLIAFYDADLVPIPAAAGRTHICAEVLRAFIALIDGHTSGSFAWRTDWRLRPDPSVTDLAMSTQAAQEYFYFQSAPWRRLAMAKARVVAGDRRAGHTFLKALHNFIWRRNLDFSMVEEIAHLKHRIHLEHPGLADQRRVSHDLSDPYGFHLKLGQGGIRDIEFIAGALQLLWGGRTRDLQTPKTQDALRHLGQAGLVQQADDLLQAYGFLRTLENTIQAYADQHVHCLPNPGPQRDWLCHVLGRSYAHICAELEEVRHLVQGQFQALFQDKSFQAPPPIHNPDLAAALGIHERAATTLAPSLNLIQGAIDRAPNPHKAQDQFRTWFSKLPGISAYLKVLQDQPRLAALAYGTLVESPLIANLIDQSPRALDCLMAHGGLLDNFSLPPLLRRGPDLVAAHPDWDQQLGALRTWINESLYLSYAACLSGQITADELQIHLRHLAEFALDLCAKVTAQHMGLRQLPFSILAMGRLGMGHMAPGSDLDLIFILHPGTDLAAGNHAVSKFLTCLNARLREGRVYEIDTRLRPSGASGPPTLRLTTYGEHQLSRAKTWEHLALTAMRPLQGTWHGDTDQIEKLKAIKQSALSRRRDLQQWRLDCQLMLRRLLEQRIDQPDQVEGEVKLAGGGLMELEYILAAQTLTSTPPPPVLTKHLNLQRQALVWQRLYGAQWAQSQPKCAKAFTRSCQQVRQATLDLLGDPKDYPNVSDHGEEAVRCL